MTKIIAGNWKMNHGPRAAKAFIEKVKPLLGGSDDQILLFPPAVSLPAAVEAVGDAAISIGAQNVYFAPNGAFTGEISIPMLRELGVHYCLIGHSERRRIFGEDDGLLNQKLQAVLAAGLVPVFCIGEQLQEREEGRTMAVLSRQLQAGLRDVKGVESGRLIIAYEPVWAIGTGKTATAAEADETMGAIRPLLSSLGADASLPILYGGSAKPENAGALLRQRHIDGLLIGNASLEPESFAEMAHWREA